ncbi:MAG TPA: hypothetical protein VF609_07175 [Flavisolibacter sp.]
MKSFDKADQTYLGTLIFASIIVGVLYFIWFKRAFPNGYHQQSSTALVAILLCFCGVSFAINRGWLFTLNTWFTSDGHNAKMITLNKRIIEDGRSSSYRLFATEYSRKDTFELKVSKEKYGQIKKGDTLSIFLEKGAFDVYFGNE